MYVFSVSCVGTRIRLGLGCMCFVWGLVVVGVEVAVCFLVV